MSPITTFSGIHDYVTPASKPRRSFGRWLQLEARAIVKAVKRQRRRRAGMHALAAMDDRMLSDIGLDRGQISAAVEGRR